MHFKTLTNLLFILFFLIASHLCAMEPPPSAFKYKIGFEFQEANKLCMGSINNPNIQKKAVFTAMKGDKKLWHLEIDGNDIEFVTPPFTTEQAEDLKLSIESITHACNILKNLIITKGDRVSFKEWVEGVQGEANEETKKRLTILRGQLSRIPREQVPIIEERIAQIEREQKGRGGPGLRIFLEKHDIMLMPNTPMYQEVENMVLNASHSWQPLFMPQITIQHSLKHTIPLIQLIASFEVKPNQDDSVL